jgi:nucleoside-diphosphate-sugar epimerase
MPSTEVLVTGASGFVGRRLVPALQTRGFRVHGFSLEDGDISAADLLFPGVRHVFHLAARMFVPESWRDPAPFYRTNVMGTVNVLELCRREQAALTLVSSYVYGTPRTLPIPEHHPLAAFNPYCQTKILAEEIAGFYTASFGVRVAVVRPFNLYGPGQDERFLIPSLVRQVLDPAAAAVHVADKRPRRDHLYVDDLVALLLATLDPGVAGVYNAGSGRSAGIDELVALINRAAGRNKPLVSEDQPRPQEVMDVVADIRRAEALGWKPRTALEDGIAEVVRATPLPA